MITRLRNTTDIHLDFIIQNVDDTPSLENPDLAPFVENQTFVANLDASDPEGVTNLYWRIPNTNDYTIFELILTGQLLLHRMY